MAYATQSAWEAAFSAAELTQLLADGRTFSRPAGEADGEVDSYLASRYLLPLSVVPERVIAVALDICRYRLYDDAAPQQVKDRYEQALAWLKDVASGKAVLLDGDGVILPGPDDGTRAGIVASDKRPTFSIDFENRYSPAEARFSSGNWPRTGW